MVLDPNTSLVTLNARRLIIVFLFCSFVYGIGRTVVPRLGSAELLLVQSKVDIERPPVDLRATTVVIGH